MERFERVPEAALDWVRPSQGASRGAAIATVVQTWGSAPRRVGAMMGISQSGEIAGSVSGGCVEGAVVAEALECIADGTSRRLQYGVNDGDAFAAGLACGGEVAVEVTPVGPVLTIAMLEELVALRAARVPVAIVTHTDGTIRLARDGFDDRFAQDRSGFEPGSGAFVTIHNPPLRLFIIGAVHIAQALVPMARIAGYDPVVIDPRDSFAATARFPGENLVLDWPGEALEALEPDARSAVVLLSHDPKLDDPALLVALRSSAFYVGALGSRRTQGQRFERMAEQGVSAADIARIHGPVGLDIGAAGPAEIAVAILAQMTQVLRRG